ncbi:MAG: NAD(P)/FAD-dependent oxidoreductase, partial [Bacteroidota bacterium]
SAMPTFPHILIIGAGAAGLHAGYLLHQSGLDFQLLEASDRIGGRLGKVEDGFSDLPLDMGAEWLHGKKSLVGTLVKQTQTTITKDKGKGRYWFQGRLKKKLPKDVWEMFEQEGLPDVSYRAYGEQMGLYPEYEQVVEGIAGDFGAAADQISAYWKIQEEQAWSSGSKDYKFARTYFDLIEEQWARPIRNHIRLNTAISRIDLRSDRIELTDEAGATFTADKVILTVPIPILQAGDIEFVPPLPKAKMEAFQKIGMGPGMKVFLRFSTAFYHQGIFGGSGCAAYVDERIGKEGEDHVLMAFIMGKQAAALSALASDQAITQALLAELDEMYKGQASESFLDARVIDWGKHPFIRGAYSFSTVGMGDARFIAAQPIENRLFFAGEAMNLNGHHQTVHGAAETGQEAVEWVLRKRLG